nr:MAG TPA: hypothetical protein [Caudoviricetes sp.]
MYGIYALFSTFLFFRSTSNVQQINHKNVKRVLVHIIIKTKMIRF